MATTSTNNLVSIRFNQNEDDSQFVRVHNTFRVISEVFDILERSDIDFVGHTQDNDEYMFSEFVFYHDNPKSIISQLRHLIDSVDMEVIWRGRKMYMSQRGSDNLEVSKWLRV